MIVSAAAEVAAKLDGVLAGLAALNGQTEEIATSVLKKDRGAEQKLTAHRARIRDAETSVSELEFLLTVAKKADERTAAEQHHQSLQAAIEKVSATFSARDKAVATFCQCAEQAVRAYRQILDKSHEIENLTPRELGMQHGFAFRGEAIIEGKSFPAGIDGLIGNELYRYSGIERPGQSGALPEAKPLGMMALLNPAASESLSVSFPRVSASILATMKTRIEEIHRRDFASIETENNHGRD
jgi:hypothetical protein